MTEAHKTPAPMGVETEPVAWRYVEPARGERRWSIDRRPHMFAGWTETPLYGPALLAAYERLSAENETLKKLTGCWEAIDSAPENGSRIFAICAAAQTPKPKISWWKDGWQGGAGPDEKFASNPGRWWPTHWLPAATALIAEIETVKRERDEARDERDEMEQQRDDARSDPWPKWTTRIIKTLESFGVEVVDDLGEIADFGDAFDDWFRESLANETVRATKAEAALAAAEENARRMQEALQRVIERDQHTLYTNFSDGRSEPRTIDGPIAEIARAALAQTEAGGEGWRTMDELPDIGRKFIALYNDGSGALIAFRHDGGFIDADGDDFTVLKDVDRWTYLPSDLEFWCERQEGEWRVGPLTLPAAPDGRSPS